MIIVDGDQDHLRPRFIIGRGAMEVRHGTGELGVLRFSQKFWKIDADQGQRAAAL
jgi:hypothetical protein